MTATGVLVPCLDCGTAADCTMGRCHDCHRARQRPIERAKGPRERPTRLDRVGPQSTQFKKLRARGKRMQPYCLDCQQTRVQIEARGDELQADHLPSGWAKTLAHEPLDLTDIDILCGRCNRERGPSGPGSKRWADWQESMRNG